jgi:hypothetical protein
MEEEAELYWKSKGLQSQMQLQIPTMNQLLSQRFSCEILFNLLSSGEKCIHHFHKDRKYRYYDPFYTAKSKNQDDLELEFRNQVRCFQACFIDDVQNGGFRYPDNLNKKDIIEDVKKWMKYAKMGNRNILYNTYEKFITLLEEEKKIIVDTIKTSKNYDSNTIDKGIFKGVKKNEVGNFLNAGMVGNKLAVDIEDKIKKDYQNGDYSIKAMLYMDPPKEKSLLRKLGEKLNLIQDDNDFK